MIHTKDRQNEVFFIREALKHVQISYSCEDMNDVLQIALDLDTIKKEIAKIDKIQEYVKVEIWLGEHVIELYPEVETKTIQEFKGFR